MLVTKDKNKFYLIIVIVAFIDLLSKVIIKNVLIFSERNMIIKGFLYLTYVKNTGIAWSLFNNNNIAITILGFILVFRIYFYIRKRQLSELELIGYGLILGGAFGNLIDRLFRGYVVDFIDIYIFGYDYPVFNIADMCIVIGVFLLIIDVLRGERHEVNSKKWN